MNFYASREYLDAAAAVYFKDRNVAVEDVRIGGETLRLLVADGRIVTKLQFLDFHQPLAETERCGPARKGRYARNVVRGVIAQREWNSTAYAHCVLAPFVDWSAFRSFDDYKAHLLARNRGLVRDRERRARSLAAAHGELVFTMNDEAADVLASAQRWKSRQLRETGHFDYFSVPQTMEFLEALRAKKVLVTSTLRAGGRLVSLWIGFVHERCWSGWIFTYDPALRKYSAGHQLLNCMLEESYRLGHREFDFSEGGEDYKMIYATHARLLGDIGRPPLGRAFTAFAKRSLQQHSPKLLAALQALKKGLKGSPAAITPLGLSPAARASSQGGA